MSRPERPAVLDRIAKLLSRTVANGASEAEAQSALTVAQRLMAEHSIAAADLEATCGPAPGVEYVAWEDGTAHSHYVTALCVVNEAFAVTGIIKTFKSKAGSARAKTVKVQMCLYGDPANVEAAAWALEFLATSFRSLWDRRRISLKLPTSAMKGYYHGLADGFLSKVEASKADLERQLPGSGTALATLAARHRQQAQAANPGMEIVKRKANDHSQYAAGFEDGRNVNLARSIGPGRQGQLVNS